MLLTIIHMHSLNLLNFVYIVVFFVETAFENAKLVILGQLKLQIFFVLSQLPTMVRNGLGNFPQEKKK